MPLSGIDSASGVDSVAALVTALNTAYLPTIFNPIAYGAKYDGSTDDSTAIQAAIDAAATVNGGIVHLAAAAAVSDTTKRIKVNSTLVVRTGVWLRGSGSTTVLTGTANPVISTPTSGTCVERVTVSDLFIQSPAGVGVQLTASGTTGGWQLGWPRVTIENVTVTDAGTDGFKIVNSGMIEQRLINCVSMRHAGWGFNVADTDNMLIGCTAGGGTSSSSGGFLVAGGNNKITSCKAYGNAGTGFFLTGAGRHVVAGSESQDNAGIGWDIEGSWCTVSGCLSDTDKAAFRINGSHTVTGCTAMTGGGGSSQVAPVGFQLSGNNAGGILHVVSPLATPVGGAVDGVDIVVNASANAAQAVAYAATIAPEPYQGSTVRVALTGNITINPPTRYHRGQRMRLILSQDATGGRAVAFSSKYKVTAVPTTASTTTTIDLVFDGVCWTQVGASTQFSGLLGIADTFTRADSTTSLGATEDASAKTWTARAGTWGISSNQGYTTATTGNPIATVDAGTTDCTVQVTIAAGLTADNARPAVIFRYVDASNYWYWQVYDARVVRVVSGASTLYFIPTALLADGDVAAVRLAGASIELLKNGSLLYALVNTANSGGTNHGIGVTNDFGTQSNARFDNFTIT